MRGLGIQPVEAAHSLMSSLKVTEETTEDVCMCVNEGGGVQSLLAVSMNRRHGQGSHRTDVSSSLITAEKNLLGRPLGQWET